MTAKSLADTLNASSGVFVIPLKYAMNVLKKSSP